MAEDAPGGGVAWPLVQALQRVACLVDLNGRRLVLQIVSDELGYPLPVLEYSQTTLHLYTIVEACRQRPNGLVTLLEVLEKFEPGTKAIAAVRQIVAEMTALGSWSELERRQLFILLSGIVVPDIPEIYGQVAGVTAPPLRPEATLEDVFLLLETLNAGPDGIPKSLLFLEHLATRVRFDLAAELREWVESKTDRMNLSAELRAFRSQVLPSRRFPAPPKPRSEAYLVFLLQPDGPSGDQFRLSHWQQLDLSGGWFPERGKDYVGPFDAVKRHVAVIAERVEGDWARYDPDIRLDFVLSRELLHLDVDQWQWEADTVLPEPLGCHFPLGVRSLERMKARKWHRAWYARWRELTAQAGTGGPIVLESGFWGPREGGCNLRELTSKFEAAPALVAFVLSAPPRRQAVTGDEIEVGLRAGFPVIVWHRENCESEEFFRTVKELLHDDDQARHLLERLRLIRLAAFAEDPGGNHVGSQLAVIWDDPERLVIPEQPGAPEAVPTA